jgi:RNA polymerase sigma factor (sigma-70 family)
MQKLTDKQIVESLQGESYTQHDEAFRAMYQQFFAGVETFIIGNSGSSADAEDTFQDALVAVFNNLRSGNFQLQSSLKTYVFSISRNLWLNKLRRQGRMVNITTEHEQIEIPENQMNVLEKGERSEIIASLIEKMGEECRQLLLYFYFDRFRMKRIMDLMGFSSEQVTKNKKSRCMKKLRAMAEEDVIFKDFFS